MIQNEIAVLKDLQLQNVRLNAELDQLVNQDYHPAVQAVLTEILTAVNNDLQALLSNLNKIYEFVIRSQNQVDKIVNKIADDHAAVEHVQHAMEAQTASLARLQEQFQGIIGVVLE